MTIKPYHNISHAITASKNHLLNTGIINEVDKWQGIKAPRPMFECFDLAWKAPIPTSQEEAALSTQANLPWAEDHFKERISGIPYNPPPSHNHWPFGVKNNERFREDDQFTHTYPERFWPKNAGIYTNRAMTHIRSGKDYLEEFEEFEEENRPRSGIRFPYGDYRDIINLLLKDPTTRQAYLPIWFPEDTGALHGGRVPCTLGYLFYMRNGYLHMSYKIRACDYLRHFRDDIYMALRLAQHTLLKLVESNPDFWLRVKLGYLTFHADNFHVFAGEEKTI